MAEVLNIFKILAKYYSPSLRIEIVEDIFDKALEDKKSAKSEKQTKECTRRKNKTINDDDDDDDDDDEISLINDEEDDASDHGFSDGMDTMEDSNTTVENVSIVKRATKDTGGVLSALLELCTTIRNLRESNNGYDNTFDCWDRVIEVSPKEQYLTFIFTLLGLAQYDPTSKIYRKLTLATARAYILSLTIPGSKGFHIFDDKIIDQAIQAFNLLDKIRDDNISKKISHQERIEIWVNLCNLCDDLKIMFRYVHFDEYKDVRNTILWELNKLLYNNHVSGYENIYAANLHTKCFEIFDEVTNSHNGDPEETFMKIMRITYCLHIFPSPKRLQNFVVGSGSTQFCEHVSDWFVAVINKYPRIVSKILKHFIECVVTNPEKEWRGEQLQRVFDYAAKYDAALYTKCNESILSFLQNASNADDIQIRSNATEMLNRILIIESKVNWEVFRHEVSNIPRAVYVIKELIHRLSDVTNSIKLKAVNGLHHAYVKGTKDAKNIMKEGMLYAAFNDAEVDLPAEPRIRFREIRFERPKPVSPVYTFEGYEIVEPYFIKLPSTLYFLLSNALAYIRRAAVLFIEHVVALNPLVIYNTRFVQEVSKLGEDPSPLVRKQSLIMIDSILSHYPNCYPVIYAWSRVIVPLFKDSDTKIVENAWECFKKRVFDNIRGIDKSNKAENFMPWVILRVLLSTQQRLFLQSCVQSAINKQIINQKILDLIESHTLTSNSTEAWMLLSFIAGKIKSKEPDALISSFIKSMLEQSWNAGQNLQIILEVLVIWINDFSHTALNSAFTCIVNLMKTGTIPPNVVSKAFNFCMTIIGKSEKNAKKSSSSDFNKKAGKSNTDSSSNKLVDKSKLKWIEDIHKTSEEYLKENFKNFNSNRTIIMSFLFIYTETNIELLFRPNKTIVHFVHRYLEHYIDTPDSEFEPEDINILNQMIILAGRFAIRDASSAAISCLLYRLMLQKTDRSTTVNNIIVCITDLCKRHTQTVELALSEILTKLRSPYLELKLVTFKNLAQLVLSDLVKLRGNLLLSLMTTLLDKSRELSNRATEFFLTYLEKKNSILFQSCLVECPFVYNGYMHFDGFESFTAAEMKMESPLKGEENSKSRQKLYKIFMMEQEETVLLMFFDNLKMLYAKVTKDPYIQCDAGCFMIKDMLFILKEICYLSFEKKDSKCSSNQNTTDMDNDIPNDVADMSSQLNASDSGPTTREKKKDAIPTMNEAIAVVEKMIGLLPKIAVIILKWDESFKKYVDDLATAICLQFSSLTDFLHPAEFWSTYRKAAKQTGTKRKKQDVVTQSDSDSEDYAAKRSKENERSTGDIPISLLFEPFLV